MYNVGKVMSSNSPAHGPYIHTHEVPRRNREVYERKSITCKLYTYMHVYVLHKADSCRTQNLIANVWSCGLIRDGKLFSLAESTTNLGKLYSYVIIHAVL